MRKRALVALVLALCMMLVTPGLALADINVVGSDGSRVSITHPERQLDRFDGFSHHFRLVPVTQTVYVPVTRTVFVLTSFGYVPTNQVSYVPVTRTVFVWR